MNKVLFIIFLFFAQFTFGQPLYTGCKIEIYLLNKNIRAFDSINRVVGKFTVKKEDLKDTAFIKNDEIISYTIEKYNINGKREYRHNILLSSSIDDRIKNLGDIPLCCGLKYALVINGEVAYGGYFWNTYSSFTSSGIISFVRGDDISFVNMYQTKEKDPRNDPGLLSCLKKSNRLILKKEKSK